MHAVAWQWTPSQHSSEEEATSTGVSRSYLRVKGIELLSATRTRRYLKATTVLPAFSLFHVNEAIPFWTVVDVGSLLSRARPMHRNIASA